MSDTEISTDTVPDEKEKAPRAPKNPMAQEYELPSRGYLYGDKLPDGRVYLSPMTIQEERLLLSMGKNRVRTFSALIDRCLEAPGMQAQDFCSGDRFFMLLMIRVLSYPQSNEYHFDLDCPACRTRFAHSVNLGDGLRIRQLLPGEGEPFEVMLPMAGKKLGLRYLRGTDEEKIEEFTRREMARSGATLGGDPAYVYRLAKYVSEIDGSEVPEAAALSFCESLMSADSVAISNCIEENEIGVELLLEYSCPRCGHLFEEDMPFTTEFFRPGRRSATKRLQ
jgi:hypothetical protein